MSVVQELVATLGLEVDEQAFDRGLLALKGLSLGLAGIGAAVGSAVVGIGAIVQSTAEAGAEIKNLSQTANVGADFFQGLAYAASEVGFEIDDLRDVFLDVAERSQAAADGADEYAKVFKNLGIAVNSTLKTMSGEDLLRKIADGFAAMPEGMQRASTASQLLGETGARLLPVLLKGSAGLDEYMRKASDAGAIMSGETLKAAIEFRVESAKLEAALAGVRNEIGSELLPEFTIAVRLVADWIRQNRKLISTPVVKFFKALSGAVEWTVENLDLLKGALVVVTSFIIASYLPALTAVTSAQVAWGAAALIAGARAAAGWAVATAASWLALAPIAAVIAAVILLADEIATFAEGGDTLLGRWITWLGTATDTSGPLGKMLEVFKATGSLIFDITDTAKWVRLGKAVIDAVLIPFRKVADVLGSIKDAIANTSFTGFSVTKVGAKDTRQSNKLKDVTGRDVTPDFIENTWVGANGKGATIGDRLFGADRYASKAPRVPYAELFGENSASPSASLGASSKQGNTYSPSVNAEVTVNVGENATPRETGDAVAKAVTGEWWSAPDMSANLVAVDQ